MEVVQATMERAELFIMRHTPGGSDSYYLCVAGVLVWLTHSYPTEEGRAGARQRLRAWLADNPHQVVLIGTAPAVIETQPATR